MSSDERVTFTMTMSILFSLSAHSGINNVPFDNYQMTFSSSSRNWYNFKLLFIVYTIFILNSIFVNKLDKLLTFYQFMTNEVIQVSSDLCEIMNHLSQWLPTSFPQSPPFLTLKSIYAPPQSPCYSPPLPKMHPTFMFVLKY